MTLEEVKQHSIEQEKSPLAKYIVGRLVELGAEHIKHNQYSFNQGVNVGMSKAYRDLLDRIHNGEI